MEAKNYNAAKRNQFDAETARIPHADYIQCLHEATVHNVRSEEHTSELQSH